MKMKKKSSKQNQQNQTKNHLIFNFYRLLGANLGKGGVLWQAKPQKS